MGLSAFMKVCVMDGLIRDGLTADTQIHDDVRACQVRRAQYLLINLARNTGIL